MSVFSKPSRTEGFKERIDKELVIFMANCLILLKILRTVVIYWVWVIIYLFINFLFENYDYEF